MNNLENEKNIFIGCDADYADASAVIFGAPFDSTTSFRPGTRFGSSFIRRESFGIETYSPYQDKDLTDHKIFDSGDIELCFGSPERALDDITERTREILSDGKLPVMLGGEHLVTLGTVRAVHEKYPDLYIIQFDAHADLRDDYLGQKLSHACVMRRCYELVGEKHIYQFGIRSGEREEFSFAKEHTNMYPLGLGPLDLGIIKKTADELGGKNVYLTIDLDVLDPADFPGTGTPEAGGMRFTDLMKALLLLKDVNIVGADMNELSPMLDTSGRSTALACKLLRELLLILTR